MCIRDSAHVLRGLEIQLGNRRLECRISHEYVEEVRRGLYIQSGHRRLERRISHRHDADVPRGLFIRPGHWLLDHRICQDMSKMFGGASAFKQAIGGWNTASLPSGNQARHLKALSTSTLALRHCRADSELDIWIWFQPKPT